MLAVSRRDDVNGTAVSRRHSSLPKGGRRSEHEHKGKTQSSMAIENRRKEGNEAKMGNEERNSEPTMNSAMIAQAERETSVLPDSQQYTYIPKIEGVVFDYNMQQAIRAVTRNKGAPGVDGITTEEIEEIMAQQWPKIKQDILNGGYYPKPVRRKEIPKPNGNGVRKLGIPTVMDRVIQQAIYQEIIYAFEGTFSVHSYGFRPGRNAHQAVLQAQEYIREGCKWVVDIDLEKFFDTVNHDILMSRVARKVKDKKILLLIRRYLQAGVMESGITKATEEGTPQGGPLSPLLSNIMLDDLDKELEARGLRFARYADDCNIYVKSEKAGQRVMESITKFLTKRLKLKVNEQKSAVARPWDRQFLGFKFLQGKEPGKIAIHKSRQRRFKDKIKEIVRKMRGRNVKQSIRKLIMPVTRGWSNYFGLAETPSIFAKLDGWIRRKIRSILWRQWKTPRTRRRKLVAFGMAEHEIIAHANSSKGPWRMSNSSAMHRAISNDVIEAMGYIPMKKLIANRS